MARKRKLEDGLSNLFSSQPEKESSAPAAKEAKSRSSKRKPAAASAEGGNKTPDGTAQPPAAVKVVKPSGSSPAARAKDTPAVSPGEDAQREAAQAEGRQSALCAADESPAAAAASTAEPDPGSARSKSVPQAVASVRDLYQPAEDVAAAVAEEIKESEKERYVVFDLGGITFGVDVHSVLTIIKRLPVCPVPHSPSYLSGLINLRGQIIPVMDLGKRISLPDRPESDENRIVVVEREKRLFGFSVDYVRSVEEIEVAQIKEPSRMITRVKEEYLSGIADSSHGLILLLALDRLLQR